MYDFTHDFNTLIAMEVAYAFASLVFLTIGAPTKGVERITELLLRMRRRRWSIRPNWTREQQLSWETQMYDELQRLQAVTKDASHRRHGVNLVLNRIRLSKGTI